MSFNRRITLATLLLAVVGLFGFAFIVGQSAAVGQGADLFSYLPLITYQEPPPRGIYGLVTQNGTPAAGVIVDLQLRQGNTSTAVLTTTTDLNGNYSFLNAPTLADGQRYYVRYPNVEGVASRVSFWFAFLITPYTAGDEVAGGDFDIANIPLGNPPPASIVNIPTLFTWGLRPATPTDNYEFNLLDDQNANIYYFYTNPPLGYVNNYTLQNLPGNMDYDETYAWTIWAYGAGGSLDTGNFGASFLAYVITFTESAEGSLHPITTGQLHLNPEVGSQRLNTTP